MPFVLCRIDDRLIHGQVVVGWGQPLRVQRIVLVDEQVAASPWEQELYRMAVPDDMEVVVASPAEAAAQLAAWHADPAPAILLTGDIEVMARLREAAPGVVTRINLGAVHQREGRTRYLPYLFLAEAEVARLRGLRDGGCVVTAQDVPSAAPVDVLHLG
ncbi:MAG: PTS sugar transporter subunit IIB [Gemmatimonadales bacterium]|nr:PTS sugar transporter subunit IIB [Gemmatimonadales bacterium]